MARSFSVILSVFYDGISFCDLRFLRNRSFRLLLYYRFLLERLTFRLVALLGGSYMYWYVFFLTFLACVLRGALSGRISRSEKPLAAALRSFSSCVVNLLSFKKNDAQEESESS